MVDHEDHTAPVLEPKIVSTWLGLPPTQLPRETMKIIRRAAQPARKKGGSGRYSMQDAVLMKLGRKLMELGITPHRVQLCVEVVRLHYRDVFRGYCERDLADSTVERIPGPLYLVGKEYSTAEAIESLGKKFTVEFQFTFHRDLPATLSISPTSTENALHVLTLENPSPDFHVSLQPEGTLAFFLSVDTQVALSILQKLLEQSMKRSEGRDRKEIEYFNKALATWYLGGLDPGSPAIVQNVTRFVQDQNQRLLRHIESIKAAST